MLKIKDVKASGYSFIVEMINESELTGSALVISIRENPSNYAIIKSVGPMAQKESGIKEGDVVILQSQYTPVPNPDSTSKRKWGSVELHAIKAIIVVE